MNDASLAGAAPPRLPRSEWGGKRIFLSTGDASGDVHAAAVAEALLLQDATVQVAALGNDALAALASRYPDRLLLWRHQESVGMGQFGFLNVVASVPRHLALLEATKRFLAAWQPDAVLLVDYGGYHLQLLKAIGKQHPCYYYIAPQVWASRAKRTAVLQRYVRKMFAIFPFEVPWYEAWQTPVQFVGHPLLHQLPPATTKAQLCEAVGLDATLPLIGFFPGSRRSELSRLFAPLLEGMAVLQSQQSQPLQVLLSQAPNLSEGVFQGFLHAALAELEKRGYPPLTLRVLQHQNHALLSAADVILGASGTTSLEAALYETPMVIAYKVDAFTGWLAKRLITIPFVGLPNLLLPKEEAPIFPELLQEACTPAAIAEALRAFLPETGGRRAATLAALPKVRAALQVGLAAGLSPAEQVATALLSSNAAS